MANRSLGLIQFPPPSNLIYRTRSGASGGASGVYPGVAYHAWGFRTMRPEKIER
jgi:hypothetical protein